VDVHGEPLWRPPDKKEIKRAQQRMISTPFLIDTFVNGTAFTDSYFDTGCLVYSVFSTKYAKSMKLPRIPIRNVPIRLAKESHKDEQPVAQYMTYATIDIDGRVERIHGYIIDDLSFPIILGKPWAERNSVRYIAEKKKMYIGIKDQRITIREKGWLDRNGPHKRLKQAYSASIVTGSVFLAIIARARKELKKENSQPPTVLAISISDINKSLAKLAERKRKKTVDEIEAELPKEIKKHADAFLDDEDEAVPPHRENKDHAIELIKDNEGKEAQVPWGPLYGMSREELLVLRKTLTDYMDKGWIRASSSPAAAPVLFVKKPGGGIRMCVDYRALNRITKPDRYPLPLIRETLRNLSTARWYTKLDVRAAFHRLRIKEGDEWKTAFRTRFGLFEWLVTPFGLAGAPATFQRYINGTLQEYLDVFCSAYMDDVLVWSDGDYLDHMTKVDQVISKLKEAGLNLDPAKCEFAVKEVKYLGFVIQAGEGVKVDPEKVEAIKAWESPSNIRGVRSFIGFANFYRDFIENFSHIATPLTQLTKKQAAFTWNKEHEEAFQRLKELFISAPILAHWDPDKDTVVECDCSGYALGAVLSQIDKKKRLRPVAYLSRKLKPEECNYPIHDKELLAVIESVKHWRGELRSLGKPFKILTDHKNLRYFMTTQSLSERQARWASLLTEYNFQLEFRAGKLAQRPDALSRREQDMPKNKNEKLEMRTTQLLKDEWLPTEAQRQKDATAIQAVIAPIDMRPIREQEDVPIATGDTIFESPELQLLWNRAITEDESYQRIHQAVANKDRAFPPELKLTVQLPECKIDTNGAVTRRDVLWVPDWEPLRTKLVQDTHDSHITGHPGRDSTLAILQRSYFWPDQSKTVRQFMRNCDVCGRTKVWRDRKKGLLKPLPIPERFHSELSIDFMTDLPSEEGSPEFMMVITDRLLKSVTLEAMHTMKAEACAERFLQCHYRFHGFPKAITSDRGSNWTGRFWKKLCELTNIEQRLSTAFHPQTDGATERMNQEVLAYLRAFVTYSQLDWVLLLPTAMLALNNRNSSVLGASPFFLTHGYHVEPVQRVERASPANTPTASAENFVQRISEAQEFAQSAMAWTQQQMEESANRSRQAAEVLQEGDKVWLSLKNISTPQPSKKLSWINAKYTVRKQISPMVYELEGIPTGIHNRFHVDLLKRASADPLPSQQTEDPQPPPLLPQTEDEEPEWAVERILRAEKRRLPGGQWERQLLVKWQGYSEPNWEPRENFENIADLDRFESEFGTGDNVGERTGMFTGPKRITRSRQPKQALPNTIVNSLLAIGEWLSSNTSTPRTTRI
jgi:hypothetical protein